MNSPPRSRQQALISIRPIRDGDASLLFNAVRESIESLSYWFTWCTLEYSLADAEQRVAGWMQLRESGEAFVFGIFGESTCELLGCVGLNDLKHEADGSGGSANLGYWIGDAHRGRGITTRAATMAAEFGFDELGLEQLEIATLPHNHASQRVAEKLDAMRDSSRQRSLDFQGEAVDALVFTLHPKD